MIHLRMAFNPALYSIQAMITDTPNGTSSAVNSSRHLCETFKMFSYIYVDWIFKEFVELFFKNYLLQKSVKDFLLNKIGEWLKLAAR